MALGRHIGFEIGREMGEGGERTWEGNREGKEKGNDREGKEKGNGRDGQGKSTTTAK